ncbi:hypothetical protein ID866_8540 [Astraeus odoratus]|nr:hypothetical protein ID866_8540 [Astraeus odoratus]
MLGYGSTDMPAEAAAYSTKNLCSDLAALLDYIGVEKAVVVGHDWGAYIAGRFALWQPDRLIALALLSIPYVPPRDRYVSLEQQAQYYPFFGYQLYFASEESAAEIEAHLPTLFYTVYRTPDSGIGGILQEGGLRQTLLNAPITEGCILSDQEHSYYVSNFRRGMIGPLSYYRTTQVRFEEERVIFIVGEHDKTCHPAAMEASKSLIDKLMIVTLAGKGHWILLEAPETIAQEILRWLEGLSLTSDPVQKVRL